MHLRKTILSLMFVISVTMLTGCINISLPNMGDRSQLERHVLKQAKSIFTTDEILMITLDGFVGMGPSQGAFSRPSMLVSLKDQLLAAEQDDFIKAVLIRINTPGGGVTASDLIYNEIMSFKKRTGLPVVIMMTELATSGGVYIAMAGDEIYAMPTTLTGSIGVITIFPNFEGLGDKIGFKMNVIKSGELKDAGSPWRKFKKQDRQVFEEMIAQYYERFFGIVLGSRKVAGATEEELRVIADGRVLSSQQAFEAKLIDGVMYPDEIIARTKKLAKVEDATLISFEYGSHYRGHIYAEGQNAEPRAEASQVNIINLELDGLTAGQHSPFMYLWIP